MPQSTKERLVEALRNANWGGQLDKIIELAAAGHYDDYESDIATPQNQLVADLRAANDLNYKDLIERVINGEFDGTKEESEAWWKREGRNLWTEDFLKTFTRGAGPKRHR